MAAFSLMWFPHTLGPRMLTGAPAFAQDGPEVDPLRCIGMRFRIEGDVVLLTREGSRPARGLVILLVHRNGLATRAGVTDGRYGFAGVCPGEYTVSPETDAHGFAQPAGEDLYLPAEGRVAVVAADVTQDLELTPVRRSIRVSVASRETTPPEGIEGISVALLADEDQVVDASTPRLSTDADGLLRFDLVECCSTRHTLRLETDQGAAPSYFFNTTQVTVTARLDRPPTTVYFRGVERSQIFAPATPGAGEPTSMASVPGDPIRPRPAVTPGLFSIVPDVVGDRVPAAVDAVRRAGFGVEMARDQFTRDRELWNTIERTVPPPLTRLGVGETVRLYSFQQDPTRGWYPTYSEAMSALLAGHSNRSISKWMCVSSSPASTISRRRHFPTVAIGLTRS